MISYKNIDSYIKAQPSGIQPTLHRLRKVIHKAVPEAEEVISYQMPAFKLAGIVMYFAAFKKHYSIFVIPKYLDAFRSELTEYKTSKSAVNIPLEKPVPVQLVTRMARYAAKANKEAAALKKVASKKKTGRKDVPAGKKSI